MDRMIFVSLPVRDLALARRFYTGLGFEVREQFCDEGVVCVVVSDAIVVMLLRRDRFAEFVDTPVADAATEVVNGLSARSRVEVDALADVALRAGGTALRTVADGPMYARSFTDPDGHVWEVIHMDAADAAR